MIARSGGIVRLLGLAWRLLTALLWLGVVGLFAAAYVAVQLVTRLDPVLAVALAVVCFVPPLVVLHFVLLVRLAAVRFGLVSAARWMRRVPTLSVLGMAPLLQSSYWLLLVAAVAGCVALLPLALGLALL
jgi:hypothetical protein